MVTTPEEFPLAIFVTSNDLMTVTPADASFPITALRVTNVTKGRTVVVTVNDSSGLPKSVLHPGLEYARQLQLHDQRHGKPDRDGQVSVTVTIADAPVANPDTFTVLEDSQLNSLDLVLNDDADNLSFAALNAGLFMGSATTPAHGTAAIVAIRPCPSPWPAFHADVLCSSPELQHQTLSLCDPNPEGNLRQERFIEYLTQVFITVTRSTTPAFVGA